MTLDTPLPEETIEKVILNLFKNTKTKPIISIEPGSSIGDGFLGVTASIKVDLNKEISHYFIKMAATDEQLRNVTLQRDIFKKEIYFYRKIYPIFNDLCLKYIKRSFEIIPKPIFTTLDDLKECIVLDNLSIKNYKVLKSKESFDKEHLMMVLRNYSLLHACGFILKKEQPDFFKELIEDSKINLMANLNISFGFDKLAKSSLDLLKKYSILEKKEDILANIDKIQEKSKSFIKIIEKLQNNYYTLLHIDCWRNNLMFRYKENKLESLKLIDFQTWSINSPIFDITLAIYTTSTSKENLDNINEFLNYYHKCLNEFLIAMGGDAEQFYPRHVLFEEWKKYAYYGLLYGIICMRGLIAGPESSPNIVEYVKDGKPLDQLFYFEIPNEKEYYDSVKVMIEHFIKNKYL